MTLLACDFRALLLSLLRSVLLVLSVFTATPACSVLPTCLPLSSPFSYFFKWDDSVDGVEPPPALDLHLVLSVCIFHHSCVSRKLSVVGRRRIQQVRAVATC
jgi:hypothetical protein